MTFSLEYPISVRSRTQRSFPAKLAVLGMLVFPFLLISATAQNNSAGSGHAYQRKCFQLQFIQPFQCAGKFAGHVSRSFSFRQRIE